MNLFRSKVVCVVLAMFFFSCSASFATVITFDDLYSNDALAHEIGSSYKESGFSFYYDNQIGLGYYGTEHDSYAGSSALVGNGGFGSYLRIWKDDSDYFSAESVDMVRSRFSNYASGSATFHARYFDERKNESQTFKFSGASNSFDQFIFNESFNRIRELGMYFGGNPSVQIDNLMFGEAVAVDEPGIPVLFFLMSLFFLFLRKSHFPKKMANQ